VKIKSLIVPIRLQVTLVTRKFFTVYASNLFS